MVLFVKPLGNGTGFKDKRKNQIFQFIGQTSENLIAKLKSRQTSPLNCSNNIVYDDAEKAEAFNTFFRLNQILMILTNQYQLTIHCHCNVWIVLFFGNMKFKMY